MAVQQGRTTRSNRGKRRSHDKIAKPTLSIDAQTGETHRRHHITADGYYRGRQVLENKQIEEDEE